MLLEDKIQPVYLSSSAHNEWRPSTDHLWRIWSDWFFFIGKWEIWKGNAFSAIFVRRLHIEARERKKKELFESLPLFKGTVSKRPTWLFLFQHMKYDIKGRRFADVDVVKPKTLEALDEIHTEVFLKKFTKWNNRKRKKSPQNKTLWQVNWVKKKGLWRSVK